MIGTAFAVGAAVLFTAGGLVLFYGLALEFRRPRRHGVTVVVTRRTAGGTEVVAQADATSDPDGITRLRFGDSGLSYEVAATVRTLR